MSSCRPSSPPPSNFTKPLPNMNPESTIYTGGLDDGIFVDPPSTDRGLHCPICFLILRDPTLLSCCGKHLCQVCLSALTTTSTESQKPCPWCREPSFNVLLNKEKKQEILAMAVYCSNKGNGCEWIGPLSDEDRHLKNKCQYIQVFCRYGCGERFLRTSITSHEMDQCINRPVEVRLESFIKQTSEKMAAQQREMEELKEQLEKHRIKEDELLSEIQQLRDREYVSQFEMIKENVYFSNSVSWELIEICQVKWKETVEKIEHYGIVKVSMDETNHCMKIKGERRMVGTAKAVIAELELSIEVLEIPSIHHDAVFYFTNYWSAIKQIEAKHQVYVQLAAAKDEQEHSTCNGSNESQGSDGIDDGSLCPEASSNGTATTDDVICKVYTAQTSYGHSVNIYTGNITEFSEADIIVCYTNERLVGIDAVSRAVIDDITSRVPGLMEDIQQCIAKTGPMDVGSLELFHCTDDLKFILTVAPSADPSLSDIKQRSMLMKMVRSVLKRCPPSSSIAVPSLGQGTPQQALYAEALFIETSSYFDSNSQSKLSKLSSASVNLFVAVDQVMPFAKILEAEFDSIELVNQPHPLSRPSSILRMLPDGVLFRAICGDITDQQVDAIVVCSEPFAQEVQHVGNGVLKALHAKGGASFEEAHKQLTKHGFKPSEGKIVETICKGMGQLHCKSVLHTAFNPAEVRKFVISCLERADKLKFASIAFSWMWEKMEDKVARNFVSFLKFYISRHKKSTVTVINVVFSNPETFEKFKDFLSSNDLAFNGRSPMKESVEPATPTSKATSCPNENGRSPSLESSQCVNGAVLSVHGFDRESMEHAKTELQTLINVLQ